MPGRMRIAGIGLAGFFCLLGAASVCHGESGDCGGGHAITYQPGRGDVADHRHVVAARSFSGAGVVHINLNRGELHLERAQTNGLLQVEISSSRPDSQLVRSLRRFDTGNGNAALDICAEEEDHVVVTVWLPTSTDLKSEINLGAGTMVLHADGIAGDRQVNLGAGTMQVYLAGDHNYASLRMNVGFGHLVDRRSNGRGSYGITSRTLTGTGSGTIELNVGAGTLELKPAG